MKISYNWLNEYLPEKLEPQKLSEILTSIGLEVESLEFFENIKGSLKGLIIGEVVSCEQHPNADKLKLTKVDVNKTETLQIVCGAPNVALGQKVIVAPVDTTIFPLNNQPLTMKVARIRGVESYGMICAEDEIGLSANHSGIYILPEDAKPGDNADKYFNVYSDWVYEIGLTPNRMDAMSHLGVAKDVCAWLSYHNNTITKPVLPEIEIDFTNEKNEFEVKIENAEACQRYSGAYLTNVEVKESPDWLKNYLIAIGQRPINNIVDVTNFVLHETGQPLHAFDADALTSKKVVIKNLPEGTIFKTLDDVERKLNNKDLMICNDNEPVCIAGVFGGIGSGVTSNTKNVFLESAWFNPTLIRQTSLKHGLRTEAAIRFEKGVDISGTIQSLKRAVLLIVAVANAKIEGNLIDVYPSKKEKKKVTLDYNYLKKLSGKIYSPLSIKNILTALDFSFVEETENDITVFVPESKIDISMPADIVEEIVRIDGLDNIDIPKTITITPSTQDNVLNEQLKEKISELLIGLGFSEIVTNSITNSRNFSEKQLANSVKLLNNLSEDLDVMRPAMLETGLEALAYNINRKNNDLKFFEFGKTYQINNSVYLEEEYVCCWLSSKNEIKNWKQKTPMPDFFTGKGIIKSLLKSLNVHAVEFSELNKNEIGIYQDFSVHKKVLGQILNVSHDLLKRFDIKQPVFFVEINFKSLLSIVEKAEIIFQEISQQPFVERDLALIIKKETSYKDIETSLSQLSIPILQEFFLFDIFESERIGTDKKSLAINFTFQNKDKTLTDDEVNNAMKKIFTKLQTDLNAEIR